MTKKSAIGDSFFLQQYDLSGDVGSVQSVSNTRALLPVTGLNQSAEHRILGRADGSINFSAWHNSSANASHAVLSALPTTDVIVSFADGSTAGDPAASLLAKQIGYGTTVGADGSIVHDVTASSNGAAVEWGVMLTAGTVTSASGTGNPGTVNAGSATTLGAAAYLHAFSIASGTATVAVQDSSDGSTGWANVTGLAFTALTAAGAERVATSVTATVKQYTRFNITGTYTTLNFFVQLARNG